MESLPSKQPLVFLIDEPIGKPSGVRRASRLEYCFLATSNGKSGNRRNEFTQNRRGFLGSSLEGS